MPKGKIEMALENLKCPGMEQTLAVFPETLACPECGNDVEIWTDEKKVKCSVCNIMVNPRQPEVIEVQTKKKKFQVTVNEFDNGTGLTLYYERYETIIPISSFDHVQKYKIACEACHKYGKNFACPPHSPNFPEYLAAQSYAKVICVRMPQEYFRNEIQGNKYRKCFRQARSILVEELLSYRKQGFLVAGSGFCLACDVCAVEEGADKCNKPNKKIYSLESLGVNLTTLTKSCFGFDLEWSVNDQESDFVCALGAIFLNGNE
jgi:predicted metal-binding protein